VAGTEPLPFGTRLWFAFACFFRVLFDGSFAARAFDAREPRALPEPAGKPELPERAAASKPTPAPARTEPDSTAALQLLALLQREGRLVDFLQQEVADFSDADIGAAARVVHEGCRKALREHVTIEPVRDEEEGARLTLEASSPDVKLVGNVQGSAPYEGLLRHRGWRAQSIKLPRPVEGHDARVLAPAEVEL
jgi:hypothetical protein